MNINFFDDPGMVPKPRHLIRVEEVAVDPYPDAKRVKVTVETTKFTPADRPNVTITALDPTGKQISTLTIIETMQNDIAVTLHLKQDKPLVGDYTLRSDLYYDDDVIQHTAQVTFTLPTTRQEGM